MIDTLSLQSALRELLSSCGRAPWSADGAAEFEAPLVLSELQDLP